MAKKKNRYQRLQQQYFKRKNITPAPYKTQITASSYILFNPKFSIDVVYTLLGVHNKSKAQMIIRGKEEDFADNPNEVYREIKEQKTLELKRSNKEI